MVTLAPDEPDAATEWERTNEHRRYRLRPWHKWRYQQRWRRFASSGIEYQWRDWQDAEGNDE